MAAASLLPSPPTFIPHSPRNARPLMPSLRFPFPRCRRLPIVPRASATSTWTPVPISSISPATPDLSLYHIAVDLGDAPSLAESHTAPGQYLQLRVKGVEGVKPAFLAIASPPGAEGFEFLVKTVPGTTAERVCGLKDRDVVELGSVMGKGFDLDVISEPEDADTMFIFATGSGISAIRSLIESGFGANKRSDVRLYYGARNLQIMAYQDRFKTWESTGIKITPVLSQPDDNWKGESGYVQHAFFKAKKIVDPSSTAAVLCGHKQMLEEITASLEADGVSKDKILLNF